MVLSMSVTSPHSHFTRALEWFPLMLNLTQSPYERTTLATWLFPSGENRAADQTLDPGN